MSETTDGVMVDFAVPTQIETSISQVKKNTLDPRAVSKQSDQEGRDNLASEIKRTRALRDEVTKTESKLNERQETTLVKIKDKLKLPDKQKVELEAQLLEERTKQSEFPVPREMVMAFYEKASETPLTNQEKRDLLKPEVLAQLSTDEYVALWKRLNPHFLSHVTRQGFRDHHAMIFHSKGLQEFHNGFVDVIKDGKKLRPPLALKGLINRDEASVTILLSKNVLRAESEEGSKERFNSLLRDSQSKAPKYPDETAIHFAAQSVANGYYGAENYNEVFFIFPSDVLASQQSFALNGKHKDLTHSQNERMWNDIFIWPDTFDDPSIKIDAGFVFLPEKVQVDPKTGSIYDSEVIREGGMEKRVMIEDGELREKFIKWAKEISEESPTLQMANDFHNEKNDSSKVYKKTYYERFLSQEMQELGFDRFAADTLVSDLRKYVYDKFFLKRIVPDEEIEELINNSVAKFMKAKDTISAKEYWEKYFSENPHLRPKHVIYYDGDPTSAIYEFQQKNGIGAADTSKTEGKLLGFDDNHVVDMKTDSRSNQGYDELVGMGNKIISEHYANKI